MITSLTTIRRASAAALLAIPLALTSAGALPAQAAAAPAPVTNLKGSTSLVLNGFTLRFTFQGYVTFTPVPAATSYTVTSSPACGQLQWVGPVTGPPLIFNERLPVVPCTVTVAAVNAAGSSAPRSLTFF